MKKMFVGRKGLVLDMVGKLFLLLLALLAGFWAYQLLASGLGGLEEEIEKLVMSSDFDNDGLINYIDPCPCGSVYPGNEKIDFDGTSYCVNSYSEERCDQAGFRWHAETARCMYVKDQCMDYIRRYYEELLS